MNENERKLYNALVEKGYTVLRNGWPDFLILEQGWDDDERTSTVRGFALELKVGADRLSPNQVIMHKALQRFGLMTLVANARFADQVRLHKRGRLLLSPEPLQHLKGRVDRAYRLLQEQVKQTELELARLKRELDAATILFTSSPTGLKDLPPLPPTGKMGQVYLLRDRDAEERLVL